MDMEHTDKDSLVKPQRHGGSNDWENEPEVSDGWSFSEKIFQCLEKLFERGITFSKHWKTHQNETNSL